MPINCNDDMTPSDINELVWLLNLDINNTLTEEQETILEGLLEFSKIEGVYELREEAKLLKYTHDQLGKLMWELIFLKDNTELNS